ncbi:histidine kinase [Paenibacillus sp. sptzw28]|uniref:sensor histidine kinase n=1 Tax=Paenibacillus sp. sptzw28 TaxID=715179 RepID=UPI001C6E7503|nr:histidine kinase [Paenibacillus sp. sptzw28]QYR22757.1 histidine kinase [Paenibacillus sp. sptzw28]
MITNYFSKLSPTRRRIVIVSVLLTVLAQIVLVYIGLSYARNMNQIVQQKRETNVSNQFFKNTLTQLGEINNLLQLLQTPDFSDFFKGYMSIRDDKTVSLSKSDLLNKLNELHLSTKMVRRIYFIGSDINQVSLIKDTDKAGFTELRHLRMDMLEDNNIGQLFLRDNNQLVEYSSKELENPGKRKQLDGNNESKAELKAFIDSLKDKLIITNGNINGVLVIIELNRDFFRTGLPEVYSAAYQFSIVNKKNEVIWASDPAQQKLISSPFSQNCPDCTQSEKELNPYPYRIIYTQTSDFVLFSKRSIFSKFILLSCISAFATFLISFFYTKKILYPFLMLSSRMKLQSRANELDLKYISDEWSKKGLHSLSLRNKLIVLFSLSVIIPTISNGLLYSQAFNQAVQSQMNVAVTEMGDFMNVSIQNRMNFMDQLINQLSVSRQLQEYLTRREDYDAMRLDAVRNIAPPIAISMFPGLNEVDYFILFDSSGQSIYSSVFSNNLDIFKIDTDYLKDSSDPYWISGYKDVFGHTTPAIIKRIDFLHYGSAAHNYLLLVPRDSLFSEINPVGSAVQIEDTQGKKIYSSNSSASEQLDYPMMWSGGIPGTNWKLKLEYSNEDIVLKNRQYYYSFFYIIVLVLILSIIISLIITLILLKPIELLKRTMTSVGEGELSQAMSYSGNNEIGDIIRSYNHMIQQLNGMISENMKIMEENVNNKVREQELLSLKTEAELRMLQAQINPHFLYNTLEAINMRSMRDGNNEISLIVGALAEMFRYSVSNGMGKVPLELELGHVQNYISIQKLRFGDQFRFELEVSDHLSHVAVAKFILQPIVENCLKHGLAGFEEGGLIRIRAVEDGELMLIEISDNGIGMDKNAVMHVNEEIQRSLEDQMNGSGKNQGGIGLSNVYHRLQLFYKGQASMKVYSSPMKGTTVSVSFPLAYE